MLEKAIALLERAQLSGLVTRITADVTDNAGLTIGNFQPAMPSSCSDFEVLRDMTQRGLALACDGDDVAAEPFGGTFSAWAESLPYP